jgi:hypothetical protein
LEQISASSELPAIEGKRRLQNQAIQFDQHLACAEIDRIWPPINLVPVRPDAFRGNLVAQDLAGFCPFVW